MTLATFKPAAANIEFYEHQVRCQQPAQQRFDISYVYDDNSISTTNYKLTSFAFASLTAEIACGVITSNP